MCASTVFHNGMCQNKTCQTNIQKAQYAEAVETGMVGNLFPFWQTETIESKVNRLFHYVLSVSSLSCVENILLNQYVQKKKNFLSEIQFYFLNFTWRHLNGLRMYYLVLKLLIESLILRHFFCNHCLKISPFKPK